MVMRYSVRIRVKESTLKVYPGLSHGMCTVNKDQINGYSGGAFAISIQSNSCSSR